MISFDPFYLLLLISFLNFIPGALLSFSILKEKQLFFVEKLFIGCALGLFLPPLVPFILAIIGISYSFTIAIATTVLFYLVAIILAYVKKPWENYKNSLTFSITNLSINKNRIISIALILLVFLSFWIRMQSYTPIYFDLDPYYYLFSATQILTLGIPPLNDQTAWYPEVVVDHRNIPALSYLESMWYSFYTSGGEYNNYLLSLVASFYPPIMAMFAIFFLYLLISSFYKREFGLIAAGVASFVPILLLKLAASEFEVQAYAFFSLAFFYAFYALAIKDRDLTYGFLAAAGLASVFLGSSSVILAVSVLVIFIPLHSLFLFFTREKEELFDFLKINSIVFFIGFALPTLIYGFYREVFMFSHLQYVIFGMVIFSGIVYFIKEKIFKDPKNMYLYSAGFVIALILLLVSTPLGSLAGGIASGGLGIAEFTQPLHRTIQEQSLATNDQLLSMLGFMGAPFSQPIDLIFWIFSLFSNLILGILFLIANSLLGTDLQFVELWNSPMMTIFFFSLIAILACFYRNLKNPTLSILFLAIIFPPILIGLIKTKYTLYAGFMFSIAFGLVLGELSIIIPKLLNLNEKDENKIKLNTKYVLYALVIIGIVFTFLQFYEYNVAPGVLMYSFQPRFQDDPLALQNKFKELCSYFSTYGSYDYDICTAAENPIAYASLGTNYQYNQKLCIYSIVNGKKETDSFENSAMQFKCIRLDSYWIESMEWIRDNPDESMRVTSWWDYGHWINYFGEKNTVLRNEHASLEMIGEVAHGYLTGTPQELKDFMIAHDSKYALFDSELIVSGAGLGGKYGALNYLSCARNNKTTVEKGYMQSLCESDHLWETVYVPNADQYQTCEISPVTGEMGIVAYKQTYGLDSNGLLTSYVNPYYCFGSTTLADGSSLAALYYLNEKYESGDLKLNKAFLYSAGTVENFNVYHLLYSKDMVWVENGELKSGWEDRSTKFYDSNLYSAFFLRDLEGFELVFESAGGNIKIFKIKE